MIVLSEEVKRLILRQRLAYVATISADGGPRIFPLGSLRVWEDDRLVWAEMKSVGSSRNAEWDPRTEIAVVDPLRRKGYRFSGQSRVLQSGPEYEKAVDLYRAEGADVSRIGRVVFVALNSAILLESPAYALGLTEEEMRRLWEEFYSRADARIVKDFVPPQEF